MMSGRKIQWACVNVCRMAVALTFILSGYVKAVDPLGTQYKIHDYLVAAGMSDIVPDAVTLGASVLLAAAEFCAGVLLLFAIHRRTCGRSCGRLRLFRRCRGADKLGDVCKECRSACLHAGGIPQTHDDGAFHKQDKPVDNIKLYGAVHTCVKRVLPLLSADT